ncbi:MAG: glycine cleavage system protein H [Deltaproteobacteria bacterium]|nr:glycine cleavage system protein H [Deltaproteobacteria bacterium]
MKLKLFKNKTKERKQVKGFRVIEDECIWMKGGVINFRKCDNDFDCNSCSFDKAMRKAMGINSFSENSKPGWVEHLQKTYRGSNRPCRHALTGRIDAPKICTLNYECYHCAFDQMLDDMDIAENSYPPEYQLASGYKMASGYYYHLGHSWVRFEHGGRVRVGFDDFLVRIFGTARSVNLPPLGETVKQNKVGFTFSRNGHEAAVLSPITGSVLALNQKALEHPEITHEDPYHEGWLFIAQPKMPKRNLKGLYYGKESSRWMETEVEKLLGLMGSEYEELAATGAKPIGDVFGNFPEIGWKTLIHHFLRTEKR